MITMGTRVALQSIPANKGGSHAYGGRTGTVTGHPFAAVMTVSLDGLPHSAIPVLDSWVAPLMTDRFTDIDPIEDLLGVLVIDMTEWQLISYLQQSMKALYGIHLAAEGSERFIFKNLKKTYGDETAGLIVKWVVWKHHGRPDGEYTRFAHFTKPRKWWTDLMAAEMQAQLNKEFAPADDGGMVSSSRLL